LKIPKGGNQNPYIEEEQTTQWSKEKVQKEKQPIHIFNLKLIFSSTFPLHKKGTQHSAFKNI
jgi:hypothetical protein